MRVLAQTALLVALTGFATADRLARAAEPVGTVAVITDIHFNPFAVPELAPRLAGSEPKEWPTILTSVSGQGFSGRGTDTNQALLTSALAALSEKAANADLVVVSGDLLGHQFEAMAAQVLGTSPTSGVSKHLPPGLRSTSPWPCRPRCRTGPS
jgi:sphingomyelin phosphodiesterase acid-like 3